LDQAPNGEDLMEVEKTMEKHSADSVTQMTTPDWIEFEKQ
jgi:hypothetical protein